MDRPKSRLANALIVAGLCAVPALYVLGYCYAGDVQYTTPALTEPFMGARWQCLIYQPASKIEAAWTKTQVDLWYESPQDPASMSGPGEGFVAGSAVYSRYGD